MNSGGAIVANLTVDDFDSIVTYENQSLWTTPDTFGPDYHPTTSQWLMGTYHKTSAIGASFSFNFTGSSIYIYGASGPQYGSFEITLDSTTSKYSAYAAQNASQPYLLYSATDLLYAKHSLRLRNLGTDGAANAGNDFLFDFIHAPFQLGPPGSTITNKTMEENDSLLKYKGEWGNNKSGNFSGGGSTYTGADGASVEFNFLASAIYVFGDKKNDHRLYCVKLSSPSGPNITDIYNGISGCGGAFGMTCEQQLPTIKYFASNLANETYHLKITNFWTENESYFDLDSIVLSVPSEFATVHLNTSTSGVAPSASPSATTAINDNSASTLNMNPFILLLVTFLWILKM